MSAKSLLSEGVRVINIGLEEFCSDIVAQGHPAIQMDWKPVEIESDLMEKLRKLKQAGE